VFALVAVTTMLDRLAVVPVNSSSAMVSGSTARSSWSLLPTEEPLDVSTPTTVKFMPLSWIVLSTAVAASPNRSSATVEPRTTTARCDV
jgi:hypothetical protein